MPNDKDKKKKSGGLLNDLAMGLGLKDRDDSYYARTAQTIQRNQGAPAAMRYYDGMHNKGFPTRGGLFAFLGDKTAGGSLPRMMGYRDVADMTDGGGKFASGGYHQGGGLYSGMANIGKFLAGDVGVSQSYADQDIDAMYGQGFAQQLRERDPQSYMRYLLMSQGIK